jgi:hypothetical protein
MYGPFEQLGEIDGVPIRVGGEGDSVPVHLQERGRPIHICIAKRDVARQLEAFLFTTTVRAQGAGKWCREEDGPWRLMEFTIHSFRKLEETPLRDVLKRLRAVSGFDRIKNPLARLNKIRHGSHGSR